MESFLQSSGVERCQQQGAAMRKRPIAAGMLGFALLVSSIVGCGGSDPIVELESSHLGILSQAYAFFMTQNRGRAPKDEQEFKAFLTAGGSTLMENRGVSDPNTLFVSERDDQPFTLLYGAAARNPFGVIGL